MNSNIKNPARVYLNATEDTATSVTELDTKPERRCNVIVEDGATTITVARNVPWVRAHIFRHALEGILEIGFSLQEDPPPRAVEVQEEPEGLSPGFADALRQIYPEDLGK